MDGRKGQTVNCKANDTSTHAALQRCHMNTSRGHSPSTENPGGSGCRPLERGLLGAAPHAGVGGASAPGGCSGACWRLGR